jgi:glycosyltransferase involved in cell wall biosynthesis
VRVLQIVPSFAPEFGGPVSSARGVASAYAPHNQIVTIGMGDAPKGWPGSSTHGFVGHRLPFGPPHVLTYSGELIDWLKRHVLDFDLVHMHLNRSATMLRAAQVVRRSGTVYRLQTHGMCTPWSGWKASIDSLLTAPALIAAQEVFTLSETESVDLRRLTDGKVRARVLFNAITDPVAERSLAGDPPSILLFCARLHPRKGLEHFIRVCHEIARRDWDIRPVVAGPDEGALGPGRQLASDLGVTVEFRGPLERVAVRELMLRSHLLLHPAPREPFGMSMLEAFSCRLPVVAAASSYLAPTFRDSEAAALADDTSVGDWADKCVDLLANRRGAEDQANRAVDLLQDVFSLASLQSALSTV